MRGRPTTLHATTVAAAIQSVARCGADVGSVLSVHRRAVNIAAPQAPGGMVALLGRPDGVPFGIACRVAGGRSMSRLGIHPGMAVVVAPGGLAIPEAGISIRLARAAVVLSTLGTVPIAPRLRIAGAASLARELLEARERGTGAGIAFELELRTRLAATVAAFQERDDEAAVRAGLSLLGLGVGLTPSGDDTLVGLAAALAATGDPRARTLAAACARDAETRTTAVAAAYLAHAARAEFSAVLRRAVAAMLGGDEGEVRASVAGLMAWGATSGADTLRGVLAGVEVALAGPAMGREAA